MKLRLLGTIPYLCILLSCTPKEVLPVEGETPLMTLFDQKMLAAVNALRTMGCMCGDEPHSPAPKLAWNAKLKLAAERHVNDMAANEHFSHLGTDSSTFGQRIEESGYFYRFAAENIARGYTSIDSVMEGWKNSPDHCKNMMHPEIKEMGSAEHDGYWVQEFGRAFQ